MVIIWVDYFINKSLLLKNTFLKIKSSLNSLDLKINTLEQNQINKEELKQEILKELREVLREPTTPITPRSNLKNIEKKVLKRLDSIQLQKAISRYIEDGYKTNQIKEEIINRFNIKQTCFYKYLKLVRQQLREPTPRINTRSK